jgi:hypothetical protein
VTKYLIETTSERKDLFLAMVSGDSENIGYSRTVHFMEARQQRGIQEETRAR